MKPTEIKHVDAYIAGFPEETQALLEQVRAAIKKAAPNAEEVISYQMPAYKLNGSPVAYFAGYRQHIGFYPTASGIANFQQEFAAYKSSKGAVQFPLDKKMPLTLIAKIVKFRVKEISEKAKKK